MRARFALAATWIGALTLGVGCDYPTYAFTDDDASGATDTGDDGASFDASSDAGDDAAADAADGADASASDATVSDVTMRDTSTGPTTMPADTGHDAPIYDAPPVGPAPTSCTGGGAPRAACSTLEGGMPGFVLDGKGDDFCSVGPRNWSAKSSPLILPSGATPPETVSVRAAVDSYGFRVFVQVLNDPDIIPSRSSDLLDGDAVEIYLRGHRASLDGQSTDEAMVVVVSPPSVDGGTSPRAAIYQNDVQAGAYSTFAAVIVEGGYQVELYAPWSAVPDQPAVGDTVGFDVAIDVADDPSTGTRQARSFMARETPSMSMGTLCMTTYGPWCDDRAMCLANAYSP
jgi:hypothetical protein